MYIRYDLYTTTHEYVCLYVCVYVYVYVCLDFVEIQAHVLKLQIIGKDQGHR